MNVIKGTVVSQPRLMDGKLIFFLRSGKKTVPVVRQKREDQKRDILFLCVGQRLLLMGRKKENYIIADKIRILHYRNRNYRLPDKKNGEKSYGNSSLCPTDSGDPGI